ncbi:MAG: hypothetical protein J2P21_08515 [Chloracidobacterium sp.]|nr:hypothetical protein [Chloracidobacterium sp.]
MKIFRTDLNAEITIISDGNKFDIKSAIRPIQVAIWRGVSSPPSRSGYRLSYRNMSKTNDRIKAFIDRIEMGFGGDSAQRQRRSSIRPDVRISPPGTAAGYHLVINFQLDHKSPEETLRSIAE